MKRSSTASIILIFVCVLNVRDVFSFSSLGQSFGPDKGQISRKSKMVLNGAGARVFFTKNDLPVDEEVLTLEAPKHDFSVVEKKPKVSVVDEVAAAGVGGLVPGTPVRAVYYASRVSVAPQVVAEVPTADEVAVAVGGLAPALPVRPVYHAPRVSIAASIPAPAVGLFRSAGNFARRLHAVSMSSAVQVLREKVQPRLGTILHSWKIWRSKLNPLGRARLSKQVFLPTPSSRLLNGFSGGYQRSYGMFGVRVAVALPALLSWMLASKGSLWWTGIAQKSLESMWKALGTFSIFVLIYEGKQDCQEFRNTGLSGGTGRVHPASLPLSYTSRLSMGTGRVHPASLPLYTPRLYSRFLS